MSDQFAERFAAVRQRFAAKLDARIDEIEAAVPALAAADTGEAMAHAHRRAHDLCDIGPTMGYVATGKAARAVEQLLLAAIKAGRALTGDEAIQLRDGVAALRSAAHAEVQSAGN